MDEKKLVTYQFQVRGVGEDAESAWIDAMICANFNKPPGYLIILDERNDDGKEESQEEGGQEASST